MILLLPWKVTETECGPILAGKLHPVDLSLDIKMYAFAPGNSKVIEASGQEIL